MTAEEEAAFEADRGAVRGATAPAAARAAIIAAIDAATAALLAPYPRSERMSFDVKAAEARAVLASDPQTFDLSIAPLLVAECTLEHGAADEPTRRSQVVAKSAAVDAKAVAWGACSQPQRHPAACLCGSGGGGRGHRCHAGCRDCRGAGACRRLTDG